MGIRKSFGSLRVIDLVNLFIAIVLVGSIVYLQYGPMDAIKEKTEQIDQKLDQHTETINQLKSGNSTVVEKLETVNSQLEEIHKDTKE